MHVGDCHNYLEQRFISLPLAPRPSLQVSAGDNKVLTLPVNTVSLYASAWPKETSGEH